MVKKKNKMKILAISHEFPPIGGGGANACYYLTKGFVAHGHEVTLVTSNFKELPEDEKINGVRVIRINAKRSNQEHCSFFEMLDFLKKSCPLVNKLYREQKFDVNIVFFGIPSGPLGYIMKKKYHIPYVIRFGGGDIPGFQERFSKVYKMIAPAIKIIWKNADALIANSEGLKELADSFYCKNKVDIITNGIDIEKFKPVEHHNENIKVLFVSRLIERKGLQYVIPQMKEIEAKAKCKIELIVVGDGPYRSTLEEIARENRVEHLIHFEGLKDKQEIVKYYQNADIFILPSRKEGMPNVVLEAMACGLPIIMTPCQGSKELVRRNGYIVSTEKFGEKIIELVNNEQLRKQQGDESRNIVCEEFTWNRVVECYIKKLEKVNECKGKL